MSFALAAVGTVDKVRKQLNAYDMTHSGELGTTVRSFLVDEVLALEGIAKDGTPDHEYMFVVDASGHSDIHALSLNITVRQVWVPREKETDA